jgi:choline-sulfatase
MENQMPDNRLNILIIICDQLSQKAVGAYGNGFARTPNIDSIAAGGVRFDQCYTLSPLCGPTRNAFWTGLYPHQTGVVSNAGRDMPLRQFPAPADIPTLAETFAAAGYLTAHFGHTYKGNIAERGMEFVAPPELGVIDEPLPVEPGNNTRLDRYGSARAAEFLRQRHDRPFLAVLDLWDPHGICQWIGDHAGPHEDEPIEGPLPELPDNFQTDDLANRPLPIQYICCSHNRLAQAAQWSESNYCHYLAAYYHYLQIADRHVGRALEALAASGAEDRTLVVFMSDHGEGLAAHRMVTKQVAFYEEITRVPLIFAGPMASGQGRLITDMTASQIDLFPTLCDCAGLTPQRAVEGRSLLPWIGGDSPRDDRACVAAQWHTEWGYTVSPGRMLRTRRHKYTCYVEDRGEELYDLHADPGEKRNLARDPAHADALAEHRRLLRELVERTGDPFFSLHAVVDTRWRSHEVGYHNHRGPAAPAAARASRTATAV